MASGKARKVRCIENGEVYNSQSEASRNLGVKQQAIGRVLKGELKQTGGYHFEYVEENAQEGEHVALTVQNEQGEPIPVIDSREVARMMGKKHDEILEYIEGKVNNRTYIIGILPTLQGEQLIPTDYFIESSYIADNGMKFRCYLCTKMGCDLLATRQKGEKGILFCAKYVKRFDTMEKELKSKSVHKYPEITEKQQCILAIYDGGASAVTASRRLVEIEVQEATAPLKATIEEQQPKVELADERLSMNGCISITDANKAFNLGQGKLMQWARNKGFIDKRKYIKEVNQAGRKYFKVYQTGKYRNIGITEEGMKLIKENKEEINSVKLHRNRK